MWFSSPIGESTFSTIGSSGDYAKIGSVFVPYRGIYFLYKIKENLDGMPTIKFSSPIGESTFSTRP